MQLSEIKNLLEIGSFIVAIIGGVIGLYFLMRKETKERTNELDKQFSGKWTNEGAIEGPEETHFLVLEFNVDKRQLSGVVSVHNLSSQTHWNCISVSGKRYGNRARIEFKNVLNGRLQTLGRAKLHMEKEIIHWKLQHGIADYFPKKTRLFRYSKSAA